jgi:membrane fusion protein, heavy metal efflux system
MRFYPLLAMAAISALLLDGVIPGGVLEPTRASATEQTHDHDQHDDHDGHDDHDEHGEQAHNEQDQHPEEGLHLSAAERQEFGIAVDTAGPGDLNVRVNLSGEIVLNPDRVAHIVPRVPGIARRILANVGDPVRQGQILAVLESRELSEIKSAYLVAKHRLALSGTTFEREEKLWSQDISSERVYLKARQELAEAGIALRVAEQKLHALGFSGSYLTGLSFDNDERFTRYEMVAPFDGSVIKKHVALGEVLKDDAEAFVVADLSSVWVQLTVHPKDLPVLRVGQTVLITTGQNGLQIKAEVAYISPTLDEKTRAATLRLVLANTEGKWRPGSFVTATVTVDSHPVSLLLPKTALQTVDASPAVFVETPDGFAPQAVQIGRTNLTHVEILAGLRPGQRYVARGAFTLKAQLSKGDFGDGHAH